MTPLQIKAARALVASPHFRWIPGMLVMSDPQKVPRVAGSPVCPSDLRARVVSAVLGRWFGVGEFCVDHPDAENEPMSDDDLPGTLPDLNDPATLGCLLALAREAWNAPHAHLVRVWAHVSVGTGVDLGVGTGVDLTMRREQVWALDLGNGEKPMPINMQTSEGEALAAAILAAPVKP